MADFYTNINIQTLIGLFVLAFCLALGLFGFLLRRFRFLDGRQFDFSHSLGLALMVAGGVLGFAVLIMLFYVQVTLR